MFHKIDENCEEEYILRDSFGSSCEDYRNPYHPGVRKNKNIRCNDEDGYLYIKKDELLKYSYAIDYLN